MFSKNNQSLIQAFLIFNKLKNKFINFLQDGIVNRNIYDKRRRFNKEQQEWWFLEINQEWSNDKDEVLAEVQKNLILSKMFPKS